MNKKTDIKHDSGLMMNAGRQSGTALLTSLIFLVILTILGFAASRSVIMQELLSRNFNDRNLAVQSAEAALKYAESCIRNSNGKPLGPGSVAATCVRPGVATPVALRPYSQLALENADSSFWTSNGTEFGSATGESPLSLPFGTLAEQPRYVIAVLNRLGCVVSQTESCQFQVSAWGTGINPTAQKVVQSVFIR